jgi:hypothetical protein
MKYSEEQLMQLSKNNLNEFLRVLNEPTTSSVELTFGAEILGSEIKDEKIILPILKRLLKHINSLVREGAVIGVTCFYIDTKPPSEILDRLQQIATSDPSNNLKSFAKGVLEDYNE